MSFFDPAKFTEEAIASLKKQLSGKSIIAASGGVDSTVAAVLVSKAVGNELLAIYVDTGYMRLGESEFVSSMLNDLGVKHKVVDASERFYEGLKGIIDPEEKRKIIGELFIRVFEEESKKLLSYCDLDWDPKCIEFHKNSRAVTTASLAQVRQPIYKSSISSWKNYSDYLGELIDSINK